MTKKTRFAGVQWKILMFVLFSIPIVGPITAITYIDWVLDSEDKPQ